MTSQVEILRFIIFAFRDRFINIAQRTIELPEITQYDGSQVEQIRIRIADFNRFIHLAQRNFNKIRRTRLPCTLAITISIIIPIRFGELLRNIIQRSIESRFHFTREQLLRSIKTRNSCFEIPTRRCKNSFNETLIILRTHIVTLSIRMHAAVRTYNLR